MFQDPNLQSSYLSSNIYFSVNRKRNQTISRYYWSVPTLNLLNYSPPLSFPLFAWWLQWCNETTLDYIFVSHKVVLLQQHSLRQYILSEQQLIKSYQMWPLLHCTDCTVIALIAWVEATSVTCSYSSSFRAVQGSAFHSFLFISTENTVSCSLCISSIEKKKRGNI